MAHVQINNILYFKSPIHVYEYRLKPTWAHGRRKNFPEGEIVDFSKHSQKYFFEGVPEVAKFHFTYSKLRKRPILLEIR